MKIIKEKINERISLNLHGKIIMFNSRDLSILEGHKGGTKIHIDGEEVYESSYHLGHCVKQFGKCTLEKVHRSFYINIYNVLEYNKTDETILMKNKKTVPLGRTFKARFLRLLKEFH